MITDIKNSQKSPKGDFYIFYTKSYEFNLEKSYLTLLLIRGFDIRSYNEEHDTL
jgi:hypothetical protein